jgi:hypothetical protein
MTKQTFKTALPNGIRVLLPYLCAIEGEANIKQYTVIIGNLLKSQDIEANINALSSLPFMYWSNSENKYVPLADLADINNPMYSGYNYNKEYRVAIRAITVLQKLLRHYSLNEAVRVDVGCRYFFNINIRGKDALDKLHRLRNNKETNELFMSYTLFLSYILKAMISQMQYYCSEFYSTHQTEIIADEQIAHSTETPIYERMWFLLMRLYETIPINIDGIKYDTLNQSIFYLLDTFDTYIENKKAVVVQLSIDQQTANQNG